MSSKNRPIYEALRQNEAKTCRVSACEKSRHRLSALCLKHRKRKKNWGHASGRLWRVNEIRRYEDVARNFIDAYRDHGGVGEALLYIEDQLERARKSTVSDRLTSVVTRCFCQLVNHDVQALDVLEKLA